MHFAAQLAIVVLLAIIAGELTGIRSNTSDLYSLVHLSSIDESLRTIASPVK